jgi:hypothetical protein
MSSSPNEALHDAAEKLLPQLDSHATVAGCPEKRSLAYRAAEIIRALLAQSATQRSEPDAAALRYLLDSTAPDGQWADQAVHNFVGAMLKQSPPPATADIEELRDHIASLHERLSQETHARQMEQERNDRLQSERLTIPKQADILLACGEMTASELRAAKAALTWFIARSSGNEEPK